MPKRSEKTNASSEKPKKIDDLRNSVLEYIGERKELNDKKIPVHLQKESIKIDRHAKSSSREETSKGKILADKKKRISILSKYLERPAASRSEVALTNHKINALQTKDGGLNPTSKTNESRHKNTGDIKNGRKFIYAIRFLWLLALFLCFFSVFIFYEVREVRKLNKVGRVKNPTIFISNSDYAKNFDALYKFYYQTDLIPSKPSQNEIKKQVMAKLTRDKVLESLIKENGIEVKEVKVDDFLKRMVYEKDESADHVNGLIKLLFGWNIDDYKKNVLRPIVLKDALQQWLSENDPQNQKVREKVEDIYKKILAEKEEKHRDELFGKLAQEYNEDEGIGPDGDMGYITKGEMPLEFDAKVFNLEPGKIELIKTRYGYHIVKVNEKIEDAGNIVIKLQQIMFKFINPEVFITQKIAEKKYTISIN